MVINVCVNHFNEKVCWTSKIFWEYPWQNVTYFCYEFSSGNEDEAPTTSASKQTANVTFFFKDFLHGFLKFSKLFHWNGWDKHWSPQNSGQLSSKMSFPEFYCKLNYLVGIWLNVPSFVTIYFNRIVFDLLLITLLLPILTKQ